MGSNAGWGYAWGIDDVCMEGTLPGHSLPVPDFTATTSRKITTGQSVSFQDLSQNATSWYWEFEGGSPSTSTSQNPTNIVYNNEGYFKVTLTATNQNGSVTKTKTDYIHVFYNCSYDSNVQDDDDASYYLANGTSYAGGYTPGQNTVGVTKYADKFTIGNLTGKVKSLAVAVAMARVVNGTTNVRFTIWDDNAGVPGTVLGFKDVAVKDLIQGYINHIEFQPVSVGSTFFAGFELPSPAAGLDTFACYLANGGVGRTNTAYCYNGTNWVTYESKFGINGSLYILPEFCYNVPSSSLPVADFAASRTQITPGTTISFIDQTTGGTAPTSWSWSFPGTGVTPASSTVQNPPSVTYANAGLYDVSLTATNSNGSDQEIKGGYIHVAPVSNIVYWNFPNNPDNATADGGITPNLTATITNWGAPTAQTYATEGATSRCASTTKWDQTNYNNNSGTYAWSVTFTTQGYTNIKLSSKQAAGSTDSPRDFSVYYSVNGGDFQFLADVPPMTTANNWTQGVLNNVQMPPDCDNAESIEVVWYQTSLTNAAGGTVTNAASTSLIDDIYITGQQCNTLPAAAGTITGPATVCQGASATYSVPTITGASSYVWTVPTGATITSGQYTNTVTVQFAQDQQAGNISVYGENMCGVGTASTKAITFNPVPARPGPISGNQSLLNGQTGVVYSVPAVPGATSYTWTLPGFLTITSGANTNSITTSVTCPGDYANMTVHANNACGASLESYAYTVGVICNPPSVDFMADNTNVVAGTTVNFYDLSFDYPTSWSWSFPGGTPATSTAKNPSVVYNTPGVYDVTLTATNTVGNSTLTKTGYIVVSPAPVALVYWNFPNNPDNATADGGIAANLTKTITVGGGVNAPTFGTAGATTQCASATNWASGANTKYWQVSFTTTGYESIKVSSKMTGNNAQSPRDFKLQYSIDGSNFTDVTGATMTLSLNNWTSSSANLNNVVLPAACNNQATVYLRWLNTSTVGIGGGAIGTARACLIDDIIVMGTPLAPPIANFTGSPTTICAGQSVSFTDASLNSPSSWSWSFPGGTPATSTAQNPTVTYNTPGTYNVSLTVTNISGSDTKTITGYITVNAAPTAAITPASASICAGGSTTLTASGGSNYNWSTGATTAAVTVNPASTTTYTVTVTNAAGCTVTANATVTVNALPTAAITPASASICAGGSTTLTASGGSSYNWSTGATTAAVTVNPASTTTYTVTVTNAAGCTATANATVTVNALPTAAITPASASICAGGSTTLTASGGSSYNWSTGATTAAVTVNPASTTTYTVTVTNAAGCTATANATVTVNALPTA
ncbi:MAG: PKD domain-containing protein, partial [Bacteroidales bacterium]|nr:PKD domain-containing protein [Bacteroidales bacterium]